MARLFGTDGVRGAAGEVLTAELALALGRAATATAWEPSGDQAPQVLIVRDTRESGEMLEAALAAGIAAAGGHALIGGVLPTPGAALLTRRHGFALAAVVSASHNPYADNGIKFFGADGTKVSDAVETRIEAIVAGESSAPRPIGRVRELHGAPGDYLRELELRFGGLELSGTRVLLDCANGATYAVAPEIFRRLGADVETIATEPDGRNINAGCGSTHVEGLAARMAAGGHDVGFAFDGDGDRVLAVDRGGAVVDGDELIALAALHLRACGRLPGEGVAVTVMTNYGFHTAMRAADIDVAVTAVGDRHVLAELLRRGWSLGGEQSGHIIETGFVPSGDGIASALLTLEALGDGDLADRDGMRRLPQRLINVAVADRGAFERSTAVAEAVAQEAARLEDHGRVLVRASGTEPLVRVMVEAPDPDECDAIAERLAGIVERELG
jgi:phosphoglucosamine mutase